MSSRRRVDGVEVDAKNQHARAVKFDFHTDADAAKTTTGADAMTSATGVELDMPIKPA